MNDEMFNELLESVKQAGDINNRNLIQLFEKNLETLKSLFEENSVIEINEEEIHVHY